MTCNGNSIMARMNRMVCEMASSSVTCDVTVGQLEDCLNEWVAHLCNGIPATCLDVVVRCGAG
jgi:hypothetical protein